MDLHELKQIIHAKGDIIHDHEITGYSTDTRTIRPGNVFFAIPGERFDGADHIDTAFVKKASVCVTQKNIKKDQLLVVPDVIKAMGVLAKNHRDRFGIPIIGITGSVGKTTTKSLINHVLKVQYQVHSTSGNLNNHIGLPMTVLDLNKEHQLSVMEMGMNHLGEIDYLASIIKPDIGILTNIGSSHIGLLGSQEKIFQAKCEMLRHMKKNALLLINGDDPWLKKLQEGSPFQIQTFGFENTNDHQAQQVEQEKNGITFLLNNERYHFAVQGKHMIYNALPAIILGKRFGMTMEQIQQGLGSFKTEKGRMTILHRKGYTLLNDTYNASPQSVKAAIDVLASHKGRKICVLGDMLELGDFAQAYHEQVGRYANEKQIDLLVACGKYACYYIKGMGKAGKSFDNAKQAGEYLRSIVEKKDVILLKGSRGMQMETILEEL